MHMQQLNRNTAVVIRAKSSLLSRAHESLTNARATDKSKDHKREMNLFGDSPASLEVDPRELRCDTNRAIRATIQGMDNRLSFETYVAHLGSDASGR